MSSSSAFTGKKSLTFLFVLICLPVVIFYGVLFSMLIDLPVFDDYAVLDFVNRLTQTKGALAQIMLVLTTQFNQYKVMLGAAIFAVQYHLLGRTSFTGLCVIGDISLLMLGVVLWKMFLPGLSDLSRRLALFVPVSWLLFQLSYAETLNWAAPAIQNLYVLVFAFASFLLLGYKRRSAFPLSVLCMVMAIAASGNGFIAALVGGIALLRQRRYRNVIVWTGAAAAMLALYVYKYDPNPSHSPQDISGFRLLLHFKLSYVLSFLGSAAVIPHNSTSIPSVVLGSLLCLFFGYMTLSRRLSATTAVNCAVVFIMLTAAGVAGIRSHLGVGQSLSSRYRIYCDLLLILAWFFVSERYLQFSSKSLLGRPLFVTGWIGAFMFGVGMDLAGYRFLTHRNLDLVNGMRAYEHPNALNPDLGPMFVRRDDHGLTVPPEVNQTARDILERSQALGTYTPPQY